MFSETIELRLCQIIGILSDLHPKLPTVQDLTLTVLPIYPFRLVAQSFSCPKAGLTCLNFLTCKTR